MSKEARPAMLVRRHLLGAGLAAGLAAGSSSPVLAQNSSAPGRFVPSPQGCVLAAGAHRVEGDVIQQGDLWLLPGAWLDMAPGSRLLLKGTLVAGSTWIFRGAGQVDLSQARLDAAVPEWWGASGQDASVDSLPAIRAALAAHGQVRLARGDYYLSAPLRVARAHARLMGAGGYGAAPGEGTRLILRGASGDVLQVGPEQRPGAINDFPRGIVVTDLTLARTEVAAVQDACGVRMAWVIDALLSGLGAREHAVGYRFAGVIHSHVEHCQAFRSLPSSRGGTVWRGFQLDGMARIGLAGGNASLYITDCNATIGGSPGVVDPVGMLAEGAFADSFVTRFETAGVACGLRVAGRAGELGAAALAGHANLHLAGLVVDQCSGVGLDISGLSSGAMVQINDPYVAIASGAEAAIRIRDAMGACHIDGGQIIGRDGAGVGMIVERTSGVQVRGVKWLDCILPVSARDVQGVSLSGWVGNPERVGQAIAVISDSSRMVIDLAASGRFQRGVVLNGVIHSVAIETMQIDPQSLGDARFASAAQRMEGPVAGRIWIL